MMDLTGKEEVSFTRKCALSTQNMGPHMKLTRPVIEGDQKVDVKE